MKLVDLYLQHQMRRRSTAVPRSCSMGMGRINEDDPCEFGEDAVAKVAVDEDDAVIKSASSDSPPDDFSLFSDPFFLCRRLFSTRSGRRGKRPERWRTWTTVSACVIPEMQLLKRKPTVPTRGSLKQSAARISTETAKVSPRRK
ncbi:uncharacterized protein LOC131316433 [Rhododendron vialii]|uniref:uncharacterized protein LOC131316433 n=1 Tax=Rhododendron vialii TaxID=182163 RepID=UPI00265FE564|nr:uncharacterized protein LOC131316433 [Rhododendron vialii]